MRVSLVALTMPLTLTLACSKAVVKMQDTADGIGVDDTADTGGDTGTVDTADTGNDTGSLDTADTADTAGGDTGTTDTSDTGAVSDLSLLIDPLAIDYGTLLPGELGTATFTVTNEGSVGATVTLTTSTSEFTLDTPRATLGAGDSTIVTVSFLAVTGGAYADDAVVLDFDGLEAGRVHLTGAIDTNVDSDGDGVLSADDCDDTDATIYPGALDAWYDGIDSDCAGNDDYDQDGDGHDAAAYGGDDCDDTDPTVYTGAADVWYDGVDSDCAGNDDFDQDADGHASADFGGDDCDDADATVYPGALDLPYDGVDSDCAGNDDFDADGDGHVSDAYGGDDCNDADATIHAGAADAWYDGVDSDCAGNDDYDQDGDGFIAAAYGGDDCDDTNARAYSGAADGWYDGVDSDCAGNDDYDQDGDGHRASAFGGDDCDDLDASVYTGALDTWYDGIDSDCGGNDDYDADGDGHRAAAYGGDDCDDTDATVYAGAADAWYDGIDSDCAGNDDYDQDADGDRALAYGGGDCDDTDATRSSLEPEVCDGLDNDCDGVRDDGFPILSTPMYPDGDSDGYGAGTPIYACALPAGYSFTILDCDDTDAAVNPGHAEVGYNYTDDDCDDILDEMIAETESSWTVVGARASDGLGNGALDLIDDVANDGNPELIACAPDLDIASSADIGACAFLDVDTAADPTAFNAGVLEYYGGTHTTASSRTSSPTANIGLGTGFASIGDTDGDGYDDVVVGASNFDFGSSTNKGMLFFMSPEYYSTTGTTALGYAYGRSFGSGAIWGESSSDALGYAVSQGDFNGDGYVEVAAGAPGYSSGTGRVYMFFRGDYMEYDDGDWQFRSENAGGADYKVAGVSSGDHLGYAVLLADVNNDGYDDLVACAPDDDDRGTSSGSCWLDLGASGSYSVNTTISSRADGYVFGTAANDQAGLTPHSLAFGDFDGDTVGDLAIGIPGYDGATTNGGAVAIWQSGAFAGVETFAGATWRVTGDGSLGTAVRLPGDVDLDGYGDLLGGAPTAGSAGRVYLFGGGVASGAYVLPTNQSASWLGDAANDAFGTSISPMRDLTGDGRDEFAVGAPGNDPSSVSNAGKVYVIPAYP